MDWDFGDIFLTMLAFFFWFTFIWMFVGAFADIFRRSDLSGWGKAGWIALICILPLLGVLVYMITRPAPTAEEVASRYATGNGYSRADELSKLAALRDKGDLTDEEFNRLKVGALT
ncbi:MAG: SHOCT domain-containing protein [Actinomycetota bacterium]